MIRRRYACASLVRRHTRRHKQYFIQFKELQYATSHFEVPVVYRIESATVNCYATQGHQTNPVKVCAQVYKRDPLLTSNPSAESGCGMFSRRYSSTAAATA